MGRDIEDASPLKCLPPAAPGAGAAVYAAWVLVIGMNGGPWRSGRGAAELSTTRESSPSRCRH